MYFDTGDGILGTNMYAYCQNDCVNRYDPRGTDAGVLPMPTAGVPWSDMWEAAKMAAQNFMGNNVAIADADGPFPYADFILAMIAAGIGGYAAFQVAQYATNVFQALKGIPKDKISFDGTNWNKIFNGTRSRGGHNWSPFGQDPKGNPSLAKKIITAIIVKVLSDPTSAEYYESNGGKVWTFIREFPSIGYKVSVTAFETAKGIFKISDAWPIKMN